MTGTLCSLIKDNPNTYWSKRSGHPEFSNFIHDDSQNYAKEAEINIKNILDYRTHEQRRNILSQKIKSFFEIENSPKTIKYVLRDINKD